MRSLKLTQTVLVCLLLIQSVGALGGGLAFILAPDGSIMGMPTEPLRAHSPFDDYLIPGLILFLVLGVFPAFTAWALYARPDWSWPQRLNAYPDQYWAWSFATYVGFGLVIWIAMQTLFIRMADPLQTAYALLGTAIVAWALLPSVRNHFQNIP